MTTVTIHQAKTQLSKLIAKAEEINYEGVSGPCDFNDIGDILDCKFRYHRVEAGKFKLVKIL